MRSTAGSSEVSTQPKEEEEAEGDDEEGGGGKGRDKWVNIKMRTMSRMTSQKRRRWRKNENYEEEHR